MKRVLILAEGQTEEAFALEVLRPHLAAGGVHVDATRIATRVRHSRRTHRGGHGNAYSHIEKDLRLLLGDTSVACVTTLIDYYALPSDFPGLSDRTHGTCYDRARHVEAAWFSRVNNSRFRPHLMLHEFEAILFTGPDVVQRYFGTARYAEELQRIRDVFASPEEIDEGRESCPSRRVEAVVSEYKKSLHGPILAAQIGLAPIRQQCPHFHQWLCALENLGDEPSI